jgi:hypothetical protein
VLAPPQRYAPQLDFGVASRASALQPPGALPAHVPQAPHADAEQQTPSTQLPLTH